MNNDKASFNRSVEESIFPYESFVRNAPEIVLYTTFISLKNSQRKMLKEYKITLPEDNFSPASRTVESGPNSYTRQEYTKENNYHSELSANHQLFAVMADTFTYRVIKAIDMTDVPKLPNSHPRSAVLNRKENKFERWQERWRLHISKFSAQNQQKLQNSLAVMNQSFSSLEAFYLQACKDTKVSLPKPYLWELKQWMDDNDFKDNLKGSSPFRETLIYGLPIKHKIREVYGDMEYLRKEFTSLEPAPKVSTKKKNSTNPTPTGKREQPRLSDGTYTTY